MKSLLTKVFAFIFIAMLTVSCASSITAPNQEVEKKPQVEQQDNTQPGQVARGESDVETSKRRPDF